jgi:zinc transporter 1/2/3
MELVARLLGLRIELEPARLFLVPHVASCHFQTWCTLEPGHAHKWAAAFALSLKLNQAALPLTARMGAFAVFVALFPVGVACGLLATSVERANPLLTPIFSALAAGTFIYLGTLHGLANDTLVARCCEFRSFSLVVLGYAIMALVAIWT